MFQEPSEIRAAEKVTCNSRGCLDVDRLLVTTPEEVSLALKPDPRRFSKDGDWIDPKLATVYVIGNEANNLYKIGYARDIRKRFTAIKGSCPIPVFVDHFVHVVGPLIAKRVEAEVHECLGEDRQHGEWFNVAPELACAMIATVIREQGYKWWDEKGRRELGFTAGNIHRKDWARHVRRGNAHA